VKRLHLQVSTTPRLSRGRAVFLLATLLIVSFSAAAFADPTKQECAAANENAQDLRTAGKLGEARAALAVCTAASCPGPIREDCAHRLDDVVAAQPTVVFDAKSASGQDLTAVRVTMDDTPFLQSLDGVARPIDPGRHHFVFEASGFHRNAAMVLVREGERDRRIRLILKPEAVPGQQPETTSAPFFDPPTRRTVGLATGAVGVAGVALGVVFALIAKSTYDHALQTECSGNASLCSSQGTRDGQAAHDQANVATVGVVVGGALLAGGAALYLTAPSGGGGVAIGGSLGRGAGGVALSARW
jgi:hypothetical protein